MVGKSGGSKVDACGTVDSGEASSSRPKSMTGFARVTARSETCELEIEIKSVNHRFFEIATKLPRHYQQFERGVRSVLQRDHRRGRFDLSVLRRPVVVRDLEGSGSVIDDSKLDEAVARFSRACKRYGVSGDHLGAFLVQAVSSLRVSDDEMQVDLPHEEKLLLDAVSAASSALLKMREEEGANLIDEITARLRTVEVCRGMIQDAGKELPQKFQKRLSERVQHLLSDGAVDPQRLALEVALLAERSDVSEELTRLDSHFQQFRAALHGSPEGVGRKLDFLMQEFGREFNTITSKAQDARIQGIVVDAKAELEKIREQVQNIE